MVPSRTNENDKLIQCIEMNILSILIRFGKKIKEYSKIPQFYIGILKCNVYFI